MSKTWARRKLRDFGAVYERKSDPVTGRPPGWVVPCFDGERFNLADALDAMADVCCG